MESIMNGTVPELVTLRPLLTAIRRRLEHQDRLTVVLDGSCASGKTTVANQLQHIYGCALFHMDDFFLRPEQRTPERYAEPGGNVDRERFLAEVLEPLRKGKEVVYRPFDCGTMSLAEPVRVTPGKLTVIEGSYSLHPALRSEDQLSVWIRVDPRIQMDRIRRRDGESAARVFAEKWIPLEQAYYEAFRPDLHCDLILPE